MRPVVVLMLLVTVLFVLDGILDHNYDNEIHPGVPFLQEYNNVGWTSFVFAFANLLMTLAVARGSERTLLGRIALSAFFIVERPLTAFVLGPKPIESIVVHLATAFVELVIFIGAVRVWRLGHSLVSEDMDAMLALDSEGPGALAVTPAIPLADPFVALPAAASRDPGTWLIGLLTMMLTTVLVADGARAGFLPDGRDWGFSGDASGWMVYLFAAVLLAVATRAVQGGTVALRSLLALALILFVERAFSPFALRVADPVQLGLHGLAAFVALGLALATASAIRDAGPATRRAFPA